MRLSPTEPIISIVTAAIKARLESKNPAHGYSPVGFSRKATPPRKGARQQALQRLSPNQWRSEPPQQGEGRFTAAHRRGRRSGQLVVCRNPGYETATGWPMVHGHPVCSEFLRPRYGGLPVVNPLRIGHETVRRRSRHQWCDTGWWRSLLRRGSPVAVARGACDDPRRPAGLRIPADVAFTNHPPYEGVADTAPPARPRVLRRYPPSPSACRRSSSTGSAAGSADAPRPASTRACRSASLSWRHALHQTSTQA